MHANLPEGFYIEEHCRSMIDNLCCDPAGTSGSATLHIWFDLKIKNVPLIELQGCGG